MIRFVALALTLSLLSGPFVFGQNEHAQNLAFHVKLLEQAGSDWQAKDVMLNFEHDRIVLRPINNETRTQTLQYSDIRNVQYSHAKTRRTMSVPMALATNIFALPLLMTKVETHWLTVESAGNRSVFTLDKNDYREVVAAFEGNAGMKVAMAEPSR